MEESRGWEGFSLSPLAEESSPLELNIPTPPQNSSKKGISPPSKTSIVLQSNLAHGEKRKNPTPVSSSTSLFFSLELHPPLSLLEEVWGSRYITVRNKEPPLFHPPLTTILDLLWNARPFLPPSKKRNAFRRVSEKGNSKEGKERKKTSNFPSLLHRFAWNEFLNLVPLFSLVSDPPTPSSPYGGTHAQNGIDKTFAYSQSGARRGCVTRDGEVRHATERDRRFLCVPQRRVEFYACLIWKWIARECGSMRRVEGTES